jgi:hypothetical protein
MEEGFIMSESSGANHKTMPFYLGHLYATGKEPAVPALAWQQLPLAQLE